MIRRLHLENFRRHADTELVFTDDAQIILISGTNGSGKTSILESITFAIYGESRNGRANLANMIRRGHEVEGMQVTMDFMVGEVEYRVKRRLDSGKHTATLSANGTFVQEGAREVAKEMSRILGMDVAGFKLAAIAQQKELDGLASLQPAKRAEQIKRLRRLDAITSAAEASNSIFKRERDLAVALAGADLPALEREVAAAAKGTQAARTAHEDARLALTELEAAIEAGRLVESTFSERQQAVARLEGSLASLADSVERASGALERLEVPPAPAMTRPLEELLHRGEALNSSIAQAEAARELAHQRRIVESDLAKLDEDMAIAARELDVLGGLDSALGDLELARTELEAESARTPALQAELLASRDRAATAKVRLATLEDDLVRTNTLGGVCTTCGQEISDEHRARQSAALDAAIILARSEHEAATSAAASASAALGANQADAQRLSADLDAARTRTSGAERASSRLLDLGRRRDVLTGRLTRLPADDVDPDDLYAAKASLALEISSARVAAEQTRQRTAALERRAQLSAELEDARSRAQSVTSDLEAARPDSTLAAAYAEQAARRGAHQDEADMLGHWRTQLAVSERDLATASAALDAAAKTEARRLLHQGQALTAANATRVLRDTADHLASAIRPGLEGAVAQLLGSMSEGRFSKVRIDPDYNIMVEDDGKFRNLTELSGGEVDLVALATRLALAQVVTDRPGMGALGFLILDEVFGSQDPGRREAILTALRGLRGTYGQILLISHVPGLEDAADLVLLVDVGDERGDSVVEVV